MDSAGLLDTTDAPVRDAIAKYEAQIADGEIVFGPEGFADTYPGQERQDAALGRFVSSHVRQV